MLIDFGEMTSRDGAFPQGTGAQSTWSPNWEAETGAKKDSWSAGLNLLAMLRGEKTGEVGGRFLECRTQEQVDDQLDEELAMVGDDEDGASARLKSTIRGLLQVDEEARRDARTAHDHLTHHG